MVTFFILKCCFSHTAFSIGEIESVVERAVCAVFLGSSDLECKSLNITLEEGMAEYLAASIVDEVKDIVAAGRSLEGSSCDDKKSPILDAKTWFDICQRKWIEMDEGLGKNFENEVGDEDVTPMLLVVEILDKLGAVKSEPEEEPDDTLKECIEVGDRVLAILEESGEWHEAVVKETDAKPTSPQTTGKHYLVVFTQWQKPQVVASENCVHEDEVVDENGKTAKDRENETYSECPICCRIDKLTFHHLIPRTTHAAYLKKGLTPQMVEWKDNSIEKYASDRLFLAHYGVNLCRKCHSQVHLAESEKSLAKDWNSLELLLSHPEIIKWAKYASKQKSKTGGLIAE